MEIKVSYESAKEIVYRLTGKRDAEKYAEETGHRHLILEYALSMPYESYSPEKRPSKINFSKEQIKELYKFLDNTEKLKKILNDIKSELLETL